MNTTINRFYQHFYRNLWPDYWYKFWSLGEIFQNFIKMRLLFLTLSFCAASTLPLSIPEKLRLYQNASGIDDEKLFDIFKNSKEGKLLS